MNWIRFDKQLPESGHSYLIAYEFDLHEAENNHKLVGKAFYCCKDGWINPAIFENEYLKAVVKYWAELPEWPHELD